MSMQAASLEVLEKANLPGAQARAIVQAIEIEIAGAQNFLATKQDIYAVKEDIHAVKEDIHAVKEDVRAVKQDIHALELKIEVMRGDLRTAIHASARDTAWRMVVAIGTQTGILLGLAYFAFAHLKP